MRWSVVELLETDSELQSAAFRPDPVAADVAASLTEWPAKIDASIPANFSVSRSQRAIE